jgi:hypothetical protein
MPRSSLFQPQLLIAKTGFSLALCCSSLTLLNPIAASARALETSTQTLAQTPAQTPAQTLAQTLAQIVVPTEPIAQIPTPTNATLAPAVARRLLQKVARDNRLSPRSLKIAEIKPQTFNGCMGIYTGPNQACTMIAINGWQAIVTSPGRTFVYHLSQNASRIVQNETASGARSNIRVSFELFGGNNTPSMERNIIFRSSSLGDMAGNMNSIVLTEDGKVTVYRSSPTARFRPVVRKVLSPAQVNEFKRVLEDQRFPNFNGLSYLTSAVFADAPATSYQSQFGLTQFIDSEKASLPRSLQRVIANWETLIRP